MNKANQLLDVSKITRNTTSISLLKHSGSSFDISLSNDKSFGLSKTFNHLDLFFIDDQSFTSSIIHHFRQNESVYRHIGVYHDKVLNFLLNNFDNKKYEEFVMKIADLCHSVYTNNCKGFAEMDEENLKKISEKSIKEIHSLLRILKFLNGQDDGK